MQSIDSEYGLNRGNLSIDSRLSAGSTQSDMPRIRKKKRGLMGKLRSLAKSGRGAESDASVSHEKRLENPSNPSLFLATWIRLRFELGW
jgi:hypothetical protein